MKFGRLPRLCRWELNRARFPSFPGQFRISKPLANDLTHGKIKAVGVVQRIVFRGAIVITEYLFINVAVKVERLDRNVGSLQSALEKRPEDFHSVDMHSTAHVALSLVDELMYEAPLQPV